ncbi:MAG: hypothetical protein AB7T06_22355 [Kofleriaceae bacterium]
MSTKRAHAPRTESSKPASAPQPSQKRSPDKEPVEPEASPLGQSPEDPIVFCADDEVARGNMERANAEPEPQALHSAKVPGVPDPAVERREKEHELDDDDDDDDDEETDRG